MQNNFQKFPDHIISLVFAYLFLIGLSTQAVAWGRDGHTAIGILAINRLQPDALRELQDLVSPLTRQAIIEACNWPDALRETEEGVWSGPLHYVNIPRGEEVYTQTRDCPLYPQHLTYPQRPAQLCVTEAIKHYATELGNRQAPMEQRRQAFAWLCHLVGDLHQPLHAGFADDRGGNNVDVVFNTEEINLHGFWDSALINQQAGSWQYLVGQLGPFPTSRAASNWSPEMVNEWTNTSHALAGQSAYPKTMYIDEDFARHSWEITQQQINLAADRLALIINTTLQKDH